MSCQGQGGSLGGTAAQNTEITGAASLARGHRISRLEVPTTLNFFFTSTSAMEDGDNLRAGAAPASLPQAVREDLVLFISENVRAETLVEGGLGLRQASAERLLAKHSVSALLALLRAASLANEEEEVGLEPSTELNWSDATVCRPFLPCPTPCTFVGPLDRSTDCALVKFARAHHRRGSGRPRRAAHARCR